MLHHSPLNCKLDGVQLVPSRPEALRTHQTVRRVGTAVVGIILWPEPQQIV